MSRFARLTLITLCGLLVYQHLLHVDLPYADRTYQDHLWVVDGTAPGPYRYRVLVPVLVEHMAGLLPVPHRSAVLAVDTLIVWGGLCAYVFGLFVFLSRRFSEGLALLGCAVAALALSSTFVWTIRAWPGSWLESALLVWGLVWLDGHFSPRSSPWRR